MKTSLTVIAALCFSSVMLSQTDKTVMAFTKSIEQEKKAEYLPAIETIKSLNDSLSYETNIRLAWLHYKAGLTKKSMDYYQKAIDKAPNAIEPRYGFGFPAYLLPDHAALIEQDKKILEIDPNNKVINGNLGSLYFYKKEYDKALPYFRKMVSLYPFDYDNNLNLAWTYLYLGKTAEAETCFNVVLLYAPKDKSAADGLTAIKKSATANEKTIAAFAKSYELSDKSDYKGAINVLKEAYDKTSYAMNLRLGWLSYLAGMQLESSAYYKTAMELMPNAVEPKLGAVYPASVLGNKTDVKAHYESVLKLDPHNTYAHYNLGLLDYAKKDYQAALVHFQKVVALYPCDTDGLLMMGWTSLQLARTSESREFFNKVLCFYPNNESALLGLKSKPESETKNKTGF
ncbi:MAG: tetratricopeptide repeat protein [Bacteroidetes bacterium]|nr:tetratricopeptide repeat protein [Bacteroidota bacterium]